MPTVAAAQAQEAVGQDAALQEGVGSTLKAFFEQIDALGGDADERGQSILGAPVDYATEIAPKRD